MDPDSRPTIQTWPQNHKLVARLVEEQVPLLVTGSTALSFYQLLDWTDVDDLDLFVRPSITTEASIILVLSEFGYSTESLEGQLRLPDKWINLESPPAEFRADLFTPAAPFSFDTLYERSLLGQLNGHSVNVICRADLGSVYQFAIEREADNHEKRRKLISKLSMIGAV